MSRFSHILPYAAQRCLFQPGHLRLGNADLRRHLHLRLALAEHAVAACHQIDGANAAGTAGGCAVLVASLTQIVLFLFGHCQLGSEGAVAHAGGVSLHDTDGVVQLVARDACADGSVSTDDVGRGSCQTW